MGDLHRVLRGLVPVPPDLARRRADDTFAGRHDLHVGTVGAVVEPVRVALRVTGDEAGRGALKSIVEGGLLEAAAGYRLQSYAIGNAL